MVIHPCSSFHFRVVHFTANLKSLCLRYVSHSTRLAFTDNFSIIFFSIILFIKVKNDDHPGWFSNLSNWKEEAWKNQGFESLTSPVFLSSLSFQSLKLENFWRWSFFTFIYDRSSNMNYFISHHFTPHGRYELNKLTSLPMCGFIANW